ncbi:fimbrial assembly protein, partial [Pseudomonadota bacterium]
GTVATDDGTVLLAQSVVAEFTLETADENGNGIACLSDDTEECPVVRGTSQETLNWLTDGYLGWRMDLPTDGERSVTTPILRNKRIIFTTLIPDSAVCEFGGDSWLMELDAETGAALTISAFDFDGDDEFLYIDNIGYSSDTVDYVAGAGGRKSVVGITSEPTILADDSREFKYSSGSKGGIEAIKENPGPQSHGRETWRQIR